MLVGTSLSCFSGLYILWLHNNWLLRYEGQNHITSSLKLILSSGIWESHFERKLPWFILDCLSCSRLVVWTSEIKTYWKSSSIKTTTHSFAHDDLCLSSQYPFSTKIVKQMSCNLEHSVQVSLDSVRLYFLYLPDAPFGESIQNIYLLPEKKTGDLGSL